MENLNIEAKMEGRTGRERKRVCSKSSSSSSSSSSRMTPTYRLKRTVLMGKKRGSTTPVPTWKMISSRSQNYVKDLSVSARKLAAVLWEIDGVPSSRVAMDIFEDKETQVVGMAGNSSKLRSMEIALSDPFIPTSSEGKLYPTKSCSFRRRSLFSSDLRNSTSTPSCLGQVDDETKANSLKDVYKGLTASKQLLQVLGRVCGVDCTSKTLVSALRRELHQSCGRVNNLIRRQKREKSDAEFLLKQIKHNAVLGEVEKEKKLRQKSEKQNKKTGAELAETKAALSTAIIGLERERKARRKVEQVCEELAKGIWELKGQFVKVREEVEKEREMFHLADLLREERVQMKLYEAKCLYEEQNALLIKLKNELEGGESSRHDKSKEIERVKESENNAVKEEESDDSDIESIELSMGEISKSFLWGNAVKNGSKNHSEETRENNFHKIAAECNARKSRVFCQNKIF